jgi:hypothetical protein
MLLQGKCAMEHIEEQLARSEQLARAATPGPWAVDPIGCGARFNIELPDGSEAIAMSQQLHNDRGNQQRAANADYIAAANPHVVLGLIRELRSAMKDNLEPN